MVAHTAPERLRGTAFGFFNLSSGIVTLIASVIAGVLWDRPGPAFCVLTVVLLVVGPGPSRT